jgi:site-specific recombinase XerD
MDYSGVREGAAIMTQRDDQKSAVEVRLNERLGKVQPVDPATGKRLPVKVDRVELLRQSCTPETFTSAMGWLMSAKVASINTARGYADDIRTVAVLMAKAGGGRFDIGTLRPKDVTVVGDLLSSAGNSPRTVNRRLNAIQSLHSFHCTIVMDEPAGKIVTKDNRPKVDSSAVSANATQALSSKELKRIYGVCKTPRETLAVHLTLAVAGRADELCEADLKHMRGSDEGIELVLSRKGGKTRAFTLSKGILGLIEEVHGGARSGPLLLNAKGERMTRYALDALLTRLGHQAGVRTCPKAGRRKGTLGESHSFRTCLACRDITPHVLRATKLTMLHVEDGWDLHKIQGFADHGSPDTTAGYIRRWQDREDRAEGVASSDKYLKRWQ